MRLKGENGIMKKRFSALQKDIDEAREECKALFDQKKELYQVQPRHKFEFRTYGIHPCWQMAASRITNRCVAAICGWLLCKSIKVTRLAARGWLQPGASKRRQVTASA